MTQAPDLIFANGLGVYGCMSNPSNTNKHEPHEYVRADIVDKLVEVIVELQGMLSDEREGQIVNYEDAALDTYRKALIYTDTT